MLLEVQNVSREFRRGKTLVEAVRGASLGVDKGQLVSVIGRSGSGKSTLINLIVGLLRPTSGSIALDGTDLTGLSDDDMTRLRSARMGYVPQGQSTLSNLSVIDNVRLPFCLSGRRGSPDQDAQELLDRLGVGHLRYAWPSSLSGGEQRRVALARALINKPEIIIADEPTGDLDEKNTAAIMRLFRSVADSGTAVLMVTHEPDAASLADALYRMEEGRLTQVGGVSR